MTDMEKKGRDAERADFIMNAHPGACLGTFLSAHGSHPQSKKLAVYGHNPPRAQYHGDRIDCIGGVHFRTPFTCSRHGAAA